MTSSRGGTTCIPIPTLGENVNTGPRHRNGVSEKEEKEVMRCITRQMAAKRRKSEMNRYLKPDVLSSRMLGSVNKWADSLERELIELRSVNYGWAIW